ncbi:G-patch domain [Phaffia rhodozyma]|uniref:G-patch domain n=1 Tax=Phaffia rhodozyma TaxID=264483 RepID=A0A0F7SWM4_PHARH|nr:G-patch domain [Phaffia rhodozyma]
MSSDSFRIHNPSASPASSAPASSAPGSPSSSSSTNSTSSFNASRPAAAFRVPHAPNRPSPLAAAAQSSGRRFVSYQGNSDSEDDEPAGGARMVSNGDRDNVGRVDQEVELGWVLDAKGKGTYITPQVRSQEIIIPSLANKDWRNSSRAASSRVATTTATKTRKTEIYLPPGAKTDPNAGPVNTREITGDGPEEGGLIRHVRLATSTVAISTNSTPEESPTGEGSVKAKEKVELTLEERALRAVLASAGEQGSDDGEELDAIPKQEDQRQNTITEEEAFRRDVETRPDESSLDDYARVPVASFGLALLKGMGWKEGQAASRTRPGMVEAYVPKSRPSLLGIGAKERDAPTLAKGEKPKKPWKVKEEARKYSPIVRVSSSKESSVSRLLAGGKIGIAQGVHEGGGRRAGVIAVGTRPRAGTMMTGEIGIETADQIMRGIEIAGGMIGGTKIGTEGGTRYTTYLVWL